MLEGLTRIQVAVVDVRIQQAAGDVRLVSKYPLGGAKTTNGERLVELGNHKGQGLHKALWAGRRVIFEVHLHGPPEHLMPPFQLGQPFMRFSGGDHELDSVLGRVVHDLIAPPGPVAVHEQCMWGPEHLDPATLHRQEEFR